MSFGFGIGDLVSVAESVFMICQSLSQDHSAAVLAQRVEVEALRELLLKYEKLTSSISNPSCESSFPQSVSSDYNTTVDRMIRVLDRCKSLDPKRSMSDATTWPIDERDAGQLVKVYGEPYRKLTARANHIKVSLMRSQKLGLPLHALSHAWKSKLVGEAAGDNRTCYWIGKHSWARVECRRHVHAHYSLRNQKGAEATAQHVEIVQQPSGWPDATYIRQQGLQTKDQIFVGRRPYRPTESGGVENKESPLSLTSTNCRTNQANAPSLRAKGMRNLRLHLGHWRSWLAFSNISCIPDTPGSSKAVLTSFVVDSLVGDIAKMDTALFYFSYGNSQRDEDGDCIKESLAKALSLLSGTILDLLSKTFQAAARRMSQRTRRFASLESSKLTLSLLSIFATTANAASSHEGNKEIRAFGSYRDLPLTRHLEEIFRGLIELWASPHERSTHNRPTPETIILGCFLCTSFVTLIAHKARDDCHQPRFILSGAIVSAIAGAWLAVDAQHFVFRFLFSGLLGGLGLSLLFHRMVAARANEVKGMSVQEERHLVEKSDDEKPERNGAGLQTVWNSRGNNLAITS